MGSRSRKSKRKSASQKSINATKSPVSEVDTTEAKEYAPLLDLEHPQVDPQPHQLSHNEYLDALDTVVGHVVGRLGAEEEVKKRHNKPKAQQIRTPEHKEEARKKGNKTESEEMDTYIRKLPEQGKKIQLVGPPSSWLGLPSLSQGLSRPASMYPQHLPEPYPSEETKAPRSVRKLSVADEVEILESEDYDAAMDTRGKKRRRAIESEVSNQSRVQRKIRSRDGRRKSRE